MVAARPIARLCNKSSRSACYWQALIYSGQLRRQHRNVRGERKRRKSKRAGQVRPVTRSQVRSPSLSSRFAGEIPRSHKPLLDSPPLHDPAPTPSSDPEFITEPSFVSSAVSRLTAENPHSRIIPVPPRSKIPDASSRPAIARMFFSAISALRRIVNDARIASGNSKIPTP